MAEYAFNYDLAQEGQIADSSTRRIDTDYMDLTAISELPFGIAVNARTNNTGGRGLVPWTTNVVSVGYDGTVFGITVFDPTQISGKYVGAMPVSVLTIGRIYVLTQIGVSIGDRAYVIEGSGLFTNVATGNTEIGVWMTSTGAITSPTLAVLSFNLEASR